MRLRKIETTKSIAHRFSLAETVQNCLRGTDSD